MGTKLKSTTVSKCYHCGEECRTDNISLYEKHFCCVGCKSVYQIINNNKLENYYCLNVNPGKTLKEISPTKFQYLDNASIAGKLVSYRDSEISVVTFFLPQIFCSSCLWLLENLNKLNINIKTSKVNFNLKQVSITFLNQHISLRQVAELLTSVGYEPHISLEESDIVSPKKDYSVATKIGIAGFCFANIMLISFPEYLGLKMEVEPTITKYFRYLNLLISLPVLLYCAQEFFVNAVHGLKQKYVNIDAPIAFAISITFSRSIYEITTNSGAGYLDSMSGIVFFMLIGRALQNRTQTALKFNRNYKSYFPIAVSVLGENGLTTKQVEEIKVDDILVLHNQEIVPVDCLLSKGKIEMDYSFITGENTAHEISIGEIVYAGGRIIGAKIEAVAIKPFAQNSFTQLWNNSVFKQGKVSTSFVTVLSQYFSIALFVLAIAAFSYWQFFNSANALNALTAALIVACPCSLLLTSSFTFGYVMELFSNKGMYVKNAESIEKMAKANHIVFDKTGTLTESNSSVVKYTGAVLNRNERDIVLSILQHSIHPLSKAIIAANKEFNSVHIESMKEIKGSGMEAWVCDRHIKLGSAEFVGLGFEKMESESNVFIKFDENVIGNFKIENVVKEGLKEMFQLLNDYQISLLSGDNNSSENQMRKIFPKSAQLIFQQKPIDKLNFISTWQKKGENVIMIGDGLNDAGALKQSDCGISVVDASFSFTPACDAILDAKKVNKIPSFLSAAKATKRLIQFTFAYSILYNVVGLSYALSAQLQPVVAAILMPSSSISIILISYFGSKFIENKYFNK